MDSERCHFGKPVRAPVLPLQEDRYPDRNTPPGMCATPGACGYGHSRRPGGNPDRTRRNPIGESDVTIRVEHRSSYTVIDNGVFNANMDLRTIGLLGWLLSKPDGWRINSTEIAAQVRNGRDAIKSSLRELERHGYLTRTRFQNDQGHWITESVVRECPPDGFVPGADPPESTGDGIPVVGSPDVGSTGAGEPVALSSTGEQVLEVTPIVGTTSSSPAPAKQSPIDAAYDRLAKGVNREEVRALCKHLRDRVGAHNPSGHKPPATPAWVTDMGRLLSAGPKDQDGRRVTADEVHLMIDLIFDRHAEPERGGFCWANQVRAPQGLRNNWTRIELAEATRRKTAASAQPVDKEQAVAAVGALRKVLQNG